AARAHPVEVDRFQHLAPEALEASREVADVQAEHPARVCRAALADQAPHQPPVAHAAAGNVARAQCQVCACAHGCQQAREVRGVVREVAVHLDQKAGAAVERMAKAGQVSGPDPVLLAAVQDLHPLALARQAVGDLARAVRRAVVHHEHAMAVASGPRENRSRRTHHALEVLGLVVGRKDQPGLAGHGSAYPRACAWSVRVRCAARTTYAGDVAEPELTNSAIADALEELGDLYELDGAIVHRVVAYRTAAKRVREAPVSVAALARAGRASELPGIGSTLQEKILALLATGTIPAAEKLRAKFPSGLIAITRLPGLGPKRARLLHDALGIDSPQALREAALAQRLRSVRGFGPKFEQGVLEALQAGTADRERSRVLLSRAIEIGEALIEGLSERAGPGLHAQLAGSAR